MEIGTWLQLATDIVIALSCAAAALATFHATMARRRSTPNTVLVLFGILVLVAGASNLFDSLSSWTSAVWPKLAVMPALALGSALLSMFLVRLIPRAAAFQDRQCLRSVVRELRQSKQRFQRAINGSLSGLWEWNVEENTVWYSDRFRQLLGYKVEEEFPDVLESWKSALHPDDRRVLFEAIEKHLYDQAGFDVEYRLRTKSGEYRWYNARGLAIRAPDGQPYLMSGSIHDIHDRKQAEEAVRRRDKYLVQKQKMESLGELAGGTAHEFNNLLQAISGQIQFAERSLPEDSAAKKDLMIASDLIDQSARFTRRLLDFSRRGPKSLAAVDLNPIVTELAAVLRPMLGANIELRLRLGEQVEPVLADIGSLKQTLLNLCINAHDAMPSGGKLVIRTCRAKMRADDLSKYPGIKPGSYAMISVSDTGNGMSSDTKQSIFKPFFTTKEIGKGTGLGLAVVYNVVKEYGGIIDVESELGHGSTFTIWLPATQQTVYPLEDNAPVRISRPEHTPVTILYAEDDEHIRRATAQMLQDHGHRVLAAGDGEEAISLFTEHAREINVALLDIVMPRLRGDEVVKRLRDGNPGLPVVFCSGYASPLIDQDALNWTDTWLINKPFKATDLFQVLENALAKTSSGQLTIT